MFYFLAEFLKNPRVIGAVAPSGKCLAKKMVEAIDFSSAACIVEYGPGTGAFTRELMKRKRQDTALILVEQNGRFCEELERKYGGRKNVHIVQGQAKYVAKYLQEYGFSQADYIVSGLPFTSLPKRETLEIFGSTRSVLGKKGVFITFQYSLLKRKIFERYFRLAGCKLAFWNIPPAYVLIMKADRGMHGKDRETGGRLYPDCGR